MNFELIENLENVLFSVFNSSCSIPAEWCFYSFSPVPKDRDKLYFKLKQGIEKKVVITVQQLSNKELAIER